MAVLSLLDLLQKRHLAVATLNYAESDVFVIVLERELVETKAGRGV